MTHAPPRSLLLLSRDVEFQRLAAAAAAAYHCPFVTLSTTPEALALLTRPSDAVILVDVGSGKLADEVLHLAFAHEQSIACYDGLHEESMLALLAHQSRGGVLGKSSALLDLAFAELFGNPDGFSDASQSIHSYLGRNTILVNRKVTASTEKEAYLAEVMALAVSRPSFVDFPALIATVTWELLMNAIYSAPFDKTTQTSRYSQIDRSQAVVLQPNEYVDLIYAASDHVFAVGVTDHFGRLPRKEIMRSMAHPLTENIADQVRQGNQGAGVGYHMIAQSVSMLSIRVRQDVSTSIVALFRQSKRRKGFIESPPCILFNFS